MQIIAFRMPLHLIKLCVGVSDVAELKAWIKDTRAGRETLDHVTRAYPKREAEILPGGSLYWVIKGMISCRQPIVSFEKVMGRDGIERCRINFAPKIVLVRPTPRRAFQGWRYLEGADAPPDLASSAKAAAHIPESMRRDLAALGLL